MKRINFYTFKSIKFYSRYNIVQTIQSVIYLPYKHSRIKMLTIVDMESFKASTLNFQSR